jgi:hypothetical protein
MVQTLKDGSNILIRHAPHSCRVSGRTRGGSFARAPGIEAVSGGGGGVLLFLAGTHVRTHVRIGKKVRRDGSHRIASWRNRDEMKS